MSSIITIAAGILVAVAVVVFVLFVTHVFNERRDNRPKPISRSDARDEAKEAVHDHEKLYHGMHGGIPDYVAEDMRRQLEASGK